MLISSPYRFLLKKDVRVSKGAKFKEFSPTLSLFEMLTFFMQKILLFHLRIVISFIYSEARGTLWGARGI